MTGKKSAQEFYEQGVEKRKKGDLGGARNDFYAALEIDSNFQEAKIALEMLDSILRFGNAEQHNV